jgi:transposase
MIRIAEPQKLDEFLECGKERSEDFKALVLNRPGKVNEVSAITGVPEATIYEWIRECNKERTASLESHRGEGGGRKPKLGAEKAEDLRAELKKKEFWTTKAVKAVVKDKFGIDYSEDQIVRILRNKLVLR